MNNKALCFKVETFGAVDGPGIRLVIFLQGCPLRCKFCHNPESWDLKGYDTKFISVSEIINLYKHNKSYYKIDNGGITITGGEPTLNMDFLIELGKECQKQNIHLTIDTSTFYFNSFIDKFHELIKYVSLWLVDIKHIDETKRKFLVGVDTLHEQEFINFLEENKKNYWVRQVLVPGYTDDKNDLLKLGLFLRELKYMERFEILPYHNLAMVKYKNLKIKYDFENVRQANDDDVKRAVGIINKSMNKEIKI